MYPFLLHGMRPLGGAATAPHNLKSFLGSFVNLAFAVAAQLAGAVASPEFLPYMDYFIRKEYGDDYYLRPDEVVDGSIHQRTIDKVITDGFEQVVYCLNEPAGKLVPLSKVILIANLLNCWEATCGYQQRSFF